jgi:hypothetical protein
MKELDLQSMIIDAVNESDGHAHKMSSRFLVGVADLLVKLRGYPAGLLEVKQRDFPSTDAHFLLDVTRPQQNFLRDFDAAGMPCGVASFLQDGSGSGFNLWLSVMSWKTISYKDSTIRPFTIGRTAHTFLGKPAVRAQHIMQVLTGWLTEWEAGHLKDDR